MSNVIPHNLTRVLNLPEVFFQSTTIFLDFFLFWTYGIFLVTKFIFVNRSINPMTVSPSLFESMYSITSLKQLPILDAIVKLLLTLVSVVEK